MNSFKEDLKNLPNDVFNKIKQILAEEYQMHDIEITGIDITTDREPTARELTEEDCAREGKKLKCKKKPDGTVKCWCVRR